MLPLEHLEELRRRIFWILGTLVVGTVIGFVLITRFDVLALLIKPIQHLLNGGKLKYLSPADPFMVTLRLAIAAGVVFALPVALYHLWAFISPILVASERKAILPAIYMAAFLFLAGAALAYFGVLPITLRFFTTFEPGSLEQNLTIDKFLSYLMKLILGFGVAFETPVIMLALGVVGIVRSEMLVKGRRFAIVIIFVVAAALTPPDVFSQLLMAVPLLFLYEVSIWLVRWTERRRDASAREYGEGEGDPGEEPEAGGQGETA
jgi:sec-independent protein translocase protein TatC